MLRHSRSLGIIRALRAGSQPQIGPRLQLETRNTLLYPCNREQTKTPSSNILAKGAGSGQEHRSSHHEDDKHRAKTQVLNDEIKDHGGHEPASHTPRHRQHRRKARQSRLEKTLLSQSTRGSTRQRNSNERRAPRQSHGRCAEKRTTTKRHWHRHRLQLHSSRYRRWLHTHSPRQDASTIPSHETCTSPQPAAAVAAQEQRLE